MKKYRIGYTQGTFDMFHIGHLNLINHAKEHCDFLIVGVNSDALVQQYKNKRTIIGENERIEIIRNLKAVDKCILTNRLDKMQIYNEEKFDVIFIGSDWKGNERWEKTKTTFLKYGVEVVFLPYTEGVSSSNLRPLHKDALQE